jgi:hypothetical protein
MRSTASKEDPRIIFTEPTLGGLQRIVVRLRNGGIQVIDATRERAIESGVIRLDLKTDSGRVQVR